MELVKVGELFTIKPDTNFELQVLKQVYKEENVSGEDNLIIKLSKIIKILTSLPVKNE